MGALRSVERQCASAARQGSLAGSDAKDAEALLLKSIALNGNSWEAYFELSSLMDRERNYSKAAEFQADAERAQHVRLSEQEKQDLDRRAASGMSRP